MKSEILSGRSILVGILTGLVLSPALIFYFLQQSPGLPVGMQNQGGSALLIENSAAVSEQEQAGLPMRLKIPRINIDTFVEHVGVTPDGAMDVPKELANAGWFNLGPRPGDIGSAVLAGHYGWKNGKASVFDKLYKLRKGDKLYIEDDKGEIITFVVRESRRYDPKADASGVFNSSDGKAHLNLITCEGDWNKDQKSYSARLVVFTDKE